MNKFAKRSLAFALVVCMLLGTMVIPTFATEDTTPIVYDFTALSQKEAATEDTPYMWQRNDTGVQYYGFGNYNANGSSIPKDWMSHWYATGEHTVKGNSYVKDLNWQYITSKGNGKDAKNNDVLNIGGYFYDNQSNRHAFNGLSYTYKPSNVAGPGGWFAVQIKFPGIGNYNVNLGYAESQFSTKQAAVYILPGEASYDQINAAVAAGTGKLENTVNMYKKGTTAGLGTESGRPYTNGLTADLGTISFDEVYDCCTVVFVNELGRNGELPGSSTSLIEARINVENLTLTPTGYTETSGAGSSANYDFDRDTCSAILTAASSVVGMYTNGTNSPYGEDGVTVTGYEVTNANKNFIASKSKFLNGSSTPIVNYPLVNAMAEKYTNNAVNWQVLGTSVASEYSFMGQGLQVNTFSNTDKYVAILLRSPGAGTYTFTANTYVNKASNGGTMNETTHMWLDAKIVKLTGDMTAANFTEYAAQATLAGSYKPDYEVHSAVTYIDAPLLTYTFEADAQYILYLSRNADADTSDTDGNGNYSSNSIFLNHIDAEPVPETKATIGDATYATLTAAIAAAQANDTIVLQKNTAVISLELPEGVTVDLNGKKLSVNAFSTALGGTIVDSAAGEGLLNVLADNANFLGEDALAESVLPIYDAANTGYRFFAYAYNAYGAESDADIAGAARFWYQITFSDDEAYELIKTGKSGITFGINLIADGDTTACMFVNSAEAEITGDAAAWAAAYAEFAQSVETPWLWIRIHNVNEAESLEVAPVISAGGLEIVLDAMAYEA